ncbi:KTSC domain-containing protein [Zobellia uliginosa]|uniref:KTSC domain-containing protein n=1 Tax=Zobellia uliginosa TaxID=143224 RepID=UPI00349FA4A2
MLKNCKHIIPFLLILFSTSCSGQDCKTINDNFVSYENALKVIKSADFSYSDDCNTSKSSWINDAKYYSCDNKTGYLLLETKSKTYIHKKIPIEKWNDFKKAESFGKYYNRNIKGRFQLVL